ncbi:TonB-dependent receptor plug domain-containing protein [Pseudomonas sp. IPO3778]|nr:MULTISPECIES: TonB-dependent receptor plug domain-containing protein [unclassified Pseudomonas]NWD17520.1 TonB-dependent receptor plug domain-containing protein [Pseudomonas sp. IPO3778]
MVITRQQMDDQGSNSIADTLRRAPGVSVQNYDSERWEFPAPAIGDPLGLLSEPRQRRRGPHHGG